MSAPSALRQSLEKHDASFSELLNLIPARYYIVEEQGEDADTKWMKNKKKRPAEEVQAAKKKAKFDKMDPDNHKTIPQIQAERAALASSSTGSSMPAALPASLKPLAPSVSITTLRAKLQTKLDSFKSRKNTTGTNTSALGSRGDGSGDEAGDEDDEVKSRDELIDETRRRRGEVRDARRRKRKEERRAEKETPVKKGKVIERNVRDEEKSVAGVKGKDAKGKGKEDFTTRAGRTSLLVDPLPFGAPSSSSTQIPESNVTFSLALPSTSSSSKSHLKVLSNPTQQLEHLARQKERLAALPEEKRKEIEEKERWAKAEERAGGGKVRDDEARLRKVVRRVEKEKGNSGKEWQDRKIATSASAAAKAKKRNENLASRIDGKRNKKLGLKPKGDKDKAKGKIFKGRDGTKGAGGYKGKKDDGRSKEGGAGGGGRPGFEGGKAGGGGKGKK